MPEIPVWINVIVLTFSAFGGLAGLAALVNSVSTAKQTQVDNLIKTMDGLARENARLRETIAEIRLQVAVMQADNIKLRARNQVLEEKYAWARSEIEKLASAILEAGIEIAKARENEP